MFRAIESALMISVRRAMPLILVASLGTASAAVAQSRPADDLRNRNLPHDLPRDLPREEAGRNGGDSSDFPTEEMHNAVDSNVRLAYARANFHRVQGSLDQAIWKMQYEFERGQDVVDATRAEKTAWDAYVATRNAAIKTVASDDKYKANVALRDGMREKIREVHAAVAADDHGHVLIDADTMKQLVNMAVVKLDYAQVASDLENKALQGDAKVADAREKLMSAGARVAAIRDRFDRTIRDSAELAAVRTKIEDARVQLIAAEAFQSGANAVAAEALDYRYYKSRTNFSSPIDYLGYGYGGYGRGGGVYRY